MTKHFSGLLAALFLITLIGSCATPRLTLEHPAVPKGLKKSGPLTCSGNESNFTISSRYIEADNTGLLIGGNCDGIIKDSYIIAGEDGIHFSANNTFNISNTVIIAKGNGLKVTSNGNITIRDSQIYGEGYGLDIGGNGDITVRGSAVYGKHYAVNLSSNGDINMSNSRFCQRASSGGAMKKLKEAKDLAREKNKYALVVRMGGVTNDVVDEGGNTYSTDCEIIPAAK